MDRVLSLLLTLLLPPGGGVGQQLQIARAAERQVGVTRLYDPSYIRLQYPGGDVAPERGVCSDVVVRAFRSIGVDLQRAVHEDMRANFDAYPRLWGLSKPDRNIDHRRVANLMRYFARRGKSLPIRSGYRAGDIVAWRLPSGLHHIGIVSTERTSDRSRPLIIHNIGAGAQRENVLHAFEIIGHYRW